jgi:hypothetical protein
MMNFSQSMSFLDGRRLFYLTAVQAVLIRPVSFGDIHKSMSPEYAVSKSENPHPGPPVACFIF